MPEPKGKNHVEKAALRIVVPLVERMKGIDIQTSLSPISCQCVPLAEPNEKREGRGPADTCSLQGSPQGAEQAGECRQ